MSAGIRTSAATFDRRPIDLEGMKAVRDQLEANTYRGQWMLFAPDGRVWYVDKPAQLVRVIAAEDGLLDMLKP